MFLYHRFAELMFCLLHMFLYCRLTGKLLSYCFIYSHVAVLQVRWNSCYAASNAFQNPELPVDRTWVTDILNMLSRVVQSCTNFKVIASMVKVTLLQIIRSVICRLETPLKLKPLGWSDTRSKPFGSFYPTSASKRCHTCYCLGRSTGCKFCPRWKLNRTKGHSGNWRSCASLTSPWSVELTHRGEA